MLKRRRARPANACVSEAARLVVEETRMLQVARRQHHACASPRSRCPAARYR
jgi:hypothetical protein